MLRKRTRYRICSAIFLLALVGIAAFGAYSGNSLRQPAQRSFLDECAASAKVNDKPKTDQQNAPSEAPRSDSSQPIPPNAEGSGPNKNVNPPSESARYECQVAIYTAQLANFTQLLFYATAIIAFAGLVQGFVLYCAFRESRKAATSAAETVEVSREIAKITRENDRAYIWGGGPLDNHNPRIFRLEVDNYGRTPGLLLRYRVGFCDRKKPIPPVPPHMTDSPGRIDEEYFDWIKPSTIGWPLDQNVRIPNDIEWPLITGRFDFQDIWGTDYFVNFILITHDSITHIQGTLITRRTTTPAIPQDIIDQLTPDYLGADPRSYRRHKDEREQNGEQQN